jgi:hypothetical protein
VHVITCGGEFLSPLLKVFPLEEFLEVSNIQRKRIVERRYEMDCLSKKNKKKWTVPSLARYREEEEERLIRSRVLISCLYCIYEDI